MKRTYPVRVMAPNPRSLIRPDMGGILSRSPKASASERSRDAWAKFIDQLYGLEPLNDTSALEAQRVGPGFEYERCRRCQGTGMFLYADSSTWRHLRLTRRLQTQDVCDRCWGSGDRANPGENLRYERIAVLRYHQLQP